MHTSWLVLLPPILVLMSAYYTKKLNPSLFLGVVSAGLIATHFSITKAISLISWRFYDQDLDTVYMYCFLISIGIIVILISKTGGAQAFANTLKKRLRTKKAVESASVSLSLLLGIDDYLSALTTGHVMRSLTDKMRIPRVKLAYLVHALAGPLVILVPVSSWTAMINNQLDISGIQASIDPATRILADPYYIYLHSIPFIFYSLFTLFTVWFIVHRRISFGPMKQFEDIATKTGDVHGNKEAPIDSIEASDKGTLADLLVPIATLISTVFIGIPWSGGFRPFSHKISLLDAFKNNTQIFLVLFIAGLLTLVVSFLLALLRHKITVSSIPLYIWQGIKLMWPAVLMLFLASTLGIMIRVDLSAGLYLAQLLQGVVSIGWLPILFFVIATVTSLITGSAWGTIALLLPIGIPTIVNLSGLQTPIDPALLPILFPLLGAIFSGAVCGDQLSPISETTIMAATSSGSYAIDHTITQAPYAFAPLIASCLAFICAGFLAGYGFIAFLAPLALGIIINSLILLLQNRPS